MGEWQLKIGNRKTGLVIRPDQRYANMWRIHYQGDISDMVNLVRAKDAAIAFVRLKGLGGSEIAKWEYRQTSREPARSVYFVEPVP
jgi:hypothetical protein